MKTSVNFTVEQLKEEFGKKINIKGCNGDNISIKAKVEGSDELVAITELVFDIEIDTHNLQFFMSR